jgi:beta-1,4-mannosyltransferase
MRHEGKVLVFPAWKDNPYLNMLYLAPRAGGLETLETTTLEGLVARAGTLRRGDAIHVHWTSPVVQRADDVDEARRRLERFSLTLAAAKREGVAIVWTVHNVLPHDAVHLETEVELHRMLADAADLVHVMSAGTSRMASEHYALPADKTTVVPHPSYQGVYTNNWTSRLARESLGISASERTVLFFGQMRPYKGLTVLMDALSSMPDASRPTLLMAGKTNAQDVSILEHHLPANVKAVRHHEFVDDADVERWFRAADIAVFPYRKVLNSGSVHLAATFGTTAVVPGTQHMRQDFGDQDWVQFFDPDDAVVSLAAVLAAPDSYADVEGPARAFADELAPYRVSVRFEQALRGVLSATDSPT